MTLEQENEALKEALNHIYTICVEGLDLTPALIVRKEYDQKSYQYGWAAAFVNILAGFKK